MSHRRAPRPLTSALEHARAEWSPDTLLAQVQTVWPEVVGAAIASEANPVSERNGVLTVACEASVWAAELDLMGPTIVERLGAAIRGGTVTRIRCVTTPIRDRR